MTTETKEAEAAEEVAQAEVVATPLVLSVEELQKQIEAVKVEAEAAKREAKAHQEYGRKTKEQLDKQQGLDARLAQQQSEIKVLTDMVAALLDKDDIPDEVEVPKKRRSEEFTSRIAQPPQNTEFMALAVEADGLAKSIGLKMDSSPELRDAYRMFRVGMSTGFVLSDAQDALEEVKKVVGSKGTHGETEAQKAERIKNEKAALRAEVLREMGLDASDTGLPSGSSIDSIPRDINKFEEWIASMSQSDFAKIAPKVRELMASGAIK